MVYKAVIAASEFHYGMVLAAHRHDRASLPDAKTFARNYYYRYFAVIGFDYGNFLGAADLIDQIAGVSKAQCVGLAVIQYRRAVLFRSRSVQLLRKYTMDSWELLCRITLGDQGVGP